MTDLLTLAEQLRLRRISAEELTRQCLQRIEMEDAQLRAWVMVDAAGALEQARRCDEEFARGQVRSWLHGIPVGVKDIINVAGWPTRAGVAGIEPEPCTEDAPVVTRLRQAGAILLGKTVTTPYAAFDPPPTQHPWLVGRTPGGSSSGSAAAVARGMCYAALATQTGGSITRPAAYCGVAGLKPTFGRVSTRGVLPLAPHLDHVGAIASSVRDLAVMLAVIAGFDPQDRFSVHLPVPPAASFLRPGPNRPRLGLISGPWDDRVEETMRQALREACDCWQQQGAVLQNLTTPLGFRDVLRWHRVIMAVEAAAFHETPYRNRPQNYPPKIAALVEEGLQIPAVEYVRCRESQEHWRRQMLTCFHAVDALVTPAAPGPPPTAETTGDPCCNAPWSFLGYPTVGFPVKRTEANEPLAVQLVGRPFCEPCLLAIAAWCEEALHRLGKI
ncbi:MAG: amidase [Gemmatales bacterium]|nr:amidase [Gemmatales bacterium]MDW8175778.1 amidase [Gemmatales bacterium]